MYRQIPINQTTRKQDFSVIFYKNNTLKIWK